VTLAFKISGFTAYVNGEKFSYCGLALVVNNEEYILTRFFPIVWRIYFLSFNVCSAMTLLVVSHDHILCSVLWQCFFTLEELMEDIILTSITFNRLILSRIL